MTQTSVEIDVKSLRELILAVLATGMKKKKVILNAYQAYLAVRNHANYKMAVLDHAELFHKYVWDGVPATDGDLALRQRVLNIALGFSELNEQEASELYSFIEEQLGSLAQEGSLEAFLIQKFDLGGPVEQKPGNRLVTIDNVDLAAHLLGSALQAAFMMDDDMNEIRIPSHGKKLKDAEILGAISEFYQGQKYSTEIEGIDTVHALRDNQKAFRVCMSNYSSLPLEFGRILITVNPLDQDGNETD